MVDCAVIKDLLPSYLDGLTSTESNALVEAHLAQCGDCRRYYEEMRLEAEKPPEAMEKKLHILRGLNRRVWRAAAVTAAVCALLAAGGAYFFGWGWAVDREDVAVSYSYEDGVLLFELTLADGRVLNAHSEQTAEGQVLRLRESLAGLGDDRGKTPGVFTYGIHCPSVDGVVQPFREGAQLTLEFADGAETYALDQIARELDVY